MELTSLGRKYLRRFIFVCGVLFGFIIGMLTNEFLTRPETKIENEFGKVKNKGGVQQVEQTTTTDLEQTKKKKKRLFQKRE